MDARQAARFGPYAIVRELGRGGMGAVLHARELATGRDVAVKTLLRPADATARERFRREADALATLDHPGIVKVHAAGEVDGRPYMVCELVEGARPLDRAAVGLPVEARAALVRDACRALGHAHGRGIVHRDVKAENLLVDAAGRVRVTDFGLAVLDAGERLTRTGAVVGTPLTMAPEQVAGARDAVGPATDVWALGVVLYQALTGALPFTADSFAELVAHICDARPTPPRALAPATTRSLEAVCLRALSRDPEDRWAHGDAMADALEAALRGERIAPRRRSLRPLAWVVAPAASLALLAAAWSYDFSTPTTARPVAPSEAPTDAPTTASSPRPAPAGAVATRQPVQAALPPAPAHEPEHVALLRREAAGGRAGAMLALGRVYRNGEAGVAQDLPHARAWYRLAAAAGDLLGMVEYGEMLLDGEGGPPDRAEGIRFIRAAAEGGDPEGASQFARLARAGQIPGDRAAALDDAVTFLRRAVTTDDIALRRTARCNFADALFARGRPEDLTEAVQELERAIQEGSRGARLDLATRLLDGTLGPPAPGRARALVEEVGGLDAGFSPGRVERLLRRCDELEAGR